MSDFIKHSKKVLSATLAVSTIVWAVGLFALAPVEVGARAGDLVKAAGNPAVYLVDRDGVTIHPFPHANVYHSWGYPANFSSVLTTDLSGFTVGNDVEFRDGSLIRALETPAVYVVSGKKLRPVVSAEVFEALGYKYENITWLPQSFLDKYGAAGETMTSTTTHPDGTLVKYATSSTVYLIQNGAKRAFASASVIASNGYTKTPVITIPSTETYSDGAGIVVTEETLMVPVGVGSAPSGTTPTTPVGSGLSVSLASTTPAASTVIAGTTASTDGAQAFVPFIKVALTAGSDGAVTVTNMSFKRSGISADSDISAIYLTEGEGVGGNLLAASSSFSSGVVTFNVPAGIITVPAGQTKYVTLRADIADDVDSGKTIAFTLESAAGITTNGAAVTGTFPLTGNIMSTANTADLGYLTIANVSPSAATTVNPGTTNYEMWKFSLEAQDQDMELRYLKISMTGSASSSDIKNFRIEVAGTVIASVATMNENDEIIFDLTSNPYKIEKGQTKNVSLYGDVMSGTNRTIHFQVQEMYHVNAFDAQYKVYTKVNRVDSWTIVQSHTSSTNTTINAGSLTISKSSDSPTGNVAAGSTSVVLAKFDFKATGEDVRVSSLKVQTPSTIAGLNDVKVYYDGNQVGSNSDSDATDDDADFTFGTSMTIPAGTTKVVEIRADIKNEAGTNLTSGDSITITLATGSGNARGMSSSTSISTTSVAGNALTVATGAMAVTENLSVQDATSANPSGVAGQAKVLIGSFVLTSGAGEGVTISQITLTDDVSTVTGSSLADTFYNLRLESAGPADANGNYASGAAIGTTVGTLTDTENTTYNFNPSPSIKLNKSQQIVVNVYADLLNSATQTQLDTVNGDTDGIIYPSTVTATGNDTSASANGTMAAGLQNVYVSSTGSLTATVDAGTPEASTVIMGGTDVELSKFKLTASNSEDIEITKIIFSIAATPASTAAIVGNGTSTIGFMKNFDLLIGGQVVATLPSAATYSSSGASYVPSLGYNGLLEYDLSSAPVTIEKNKNTVVTIRADVNTGIDSNAQYEVIIDGDYSNYTGTQSPITARGKQSNTSLTGTNIVGASTNLDSTNTHIVRKSKPTFVTSGTGGTLSNTTTTIYKFSVTADANEDVSLKKLTLDVSLTDADGDHALKLTSFRIKESGSTNMSNIGFFNDSANNVTTNLTTVAADLAGDRSSGSGSLTDVATTGLVYMIFGWNQTSTTNEELVIPAGATKTYEIVASITGSETNDQVSTRLATLNESAIEVVSGGVVYDATTRMSIGSSDDDDYLIWSDNASASHDATVDASSTDWYNGYLIKNFPTEYYTLSR